MEAVQVTKPAFIVAELPDSVAAWVRETRRRFEPAISPLAGSSGVGRIVNGQNVESIRTKLASALAGRLPFEARFDGIGNFPGTEIFFASPVQEPFLVLHAAIATSGIGFEPNQFPYRAHCSLKGATPLRPGERDALLALPVPAEPFTIRSVSVYEMERMQPARLFSIEP